MMINRDNVLSYIFVYTRQPSILERQLKVYLYIVKFLFWWIGSSLLLQCIGVMASCNNIPQYNVK